MLPSIFQRPLSDLSRVGERISTLLKKLDLTTQEDLLYHFPVRYEDFRNTSTLDSVPINRDITVQGTVSVIANKTTFRRRMTVTEALIEDASSSLRVIWYNQPYLTKTLLVGDHISLSGQVIQDKYGLYMRSPQYEKIHTDAPTTHTGRLVPIYASTAGVTQKQIRFLVKQVLELTRYIEEWLPPTTLREHKLLPLAAALTAIHFPPDSKTLAAAQKRLHFDEMFTIQLGVLNYQKFLQSEPALNIPFAQAAVQNFVKTLPFTLTGDQKKSAWQIIRDCSSSKPMNRLLEGDVGSGKTVVAAIAAYNCVLAGHQVALMSPTEILAQQTFAAFQKLLPEGVRLALLTGSVKHDISDADIVVGTHALIQDNVKFRSLGLVIIDEQHRFGVVQRKALKEKAGTAHVPHLLSMTATPIPRSLALTVYGNLEVSIIREKPALRKPVITRLVTAAQRGEAYDFVRRQIVGGRQAMVICPLVEESDALGIKAVTEEQKKLQSEIFPEFTVGLLHGRLRPRDKAKIMHAFSGGKIHILVATSVVEVGIDIPNATVIMIEAADRFGLAQLNQFRGRVGRAEHQSYCLLFPDASGRHNKRLEAMLATNDGFALAEKDLRIRGSGSMYGLEQSGFADISATLLTDIALINQTREAARRLLHDDPGLAGFPHIKKRLTEWQESFHVE